MTKALFDDLADSYDQWYQTSGGRVVDFFERKAIEALFVPEGKTVLEIGCGTGLYTIWLAAQGFELTAVDISAPMMERAKEKVAALGRKVNWIRGDIVKLLRDLGPYDGILSMTAFEFVPYPELVLRELYRRLNPGGCLVIGVIGDHSSWSEKYRRSAAQNPASVFNRAKFFTEEEIKSWDIGADPWIEGVLYFSPDTESMAAALKSEKNKVGNPGFLVARWKK
jgi:ubiquinone/menaquinone biosynthesis C-methylase UbiE